MFQDVSPNFPGLQGWCVDLTGPVSGSVVTDAFGNFTFTIPGGTYTVCEEIQPNWHQTFPPAPQGGAVCPAGFGYQFTVMDGGSAGFNNFGNVSP